MGCGPSSRAQHGKDLKLTGSNLIFAQGQLAALNSYFSDLVDNAECFAKDPGNEKSLVLIERLIQRLVCGVGVLDSRFSSKFLITLEPHKLNNKPGNSLSYLVRLDELSSPSLYPETAGPTCHLVEPEGGPQGFARLRISGPGSENWAEFVSSQGYLRRDKVQERFVELLAQSAARSNVIGRPCEVDESRVCGSPGKVVDATHLHRMLQTSAKEQLYYGTGESYSKKFPDPRDFRIAIVEGCSCVRLRVGMIYSRDIGVETDVEVTLVLGIGFTSWPNSAQFPARIDLTHPECLLYHQASTTGFYVVPAPPHPTLRCDDRPSTWQLRFPAAEQTLAKHYSAGSVPGRTLTVLRALLHDLRSTTNGGHVLSDYMVKTLLWFKLEEAPALTQWTHDKLAIQVLTIADRLVTALRTQRHPSYFFPWFNIMLNSPGGGTLHYTEEDYTHDAELLTYYLRRLTDSSPALAQCCDPWQKMESALIAKWTDVVTDLTPPQATRSTRLSFYPLSSSGYSTIAASQYSIRQLSYIGQLLRSLLIVRSLTLTKSSSLPVWSHHRYSHQVENSHNEDLIFLISSILEQAKHAYLGTSRLVTTYRRTSGPRSRPRTVCEAYDLAANRLLDEVRINKSSQELDINDDRAVVRDVIKWLYHGVDSEKKTLAPVLRPYMDKLFTVSHENCWYATEWNRRQESDEIKALGKFCRLVSDGKISVNDGIVDAYCKGWSWAESIIKTSSELADGVELILTPASGKVIRHRVTETKLDLNLVGMSRSLGRRKVTSDGKVLTSATLPRHTKPFRECLKSRLNRTKEDDELLTTSHNILKNANPMVLTMEAMHRYGNHRGLGSIVHALITLRKFSVLQEVSGMLPESDRSQVLDEIQRVSKEVRRPRNLARSVSARIKPSQIYRSTNELSLVPVEDGEGIIAVGETLVGTCRQIRVRGSYPSVFNPAFFRAPETEAVSPMYADSPFRQNKLSNENEMMHLMRSTRRKQIRKNDITTKL
ncbi:uncharacterized protein isoform X2 [Rhodnius prolixus]